MSKYTSVTSQYTLGVFLDKERVAVRRGYGQATDVMRTLTESMKPSASVIVCVESFSSRAESTSLRGIEIR